MLKPSPPAHFLGLDLAPMQECTALAVVERTGKVEHLRLVYHHAVRYLHRWPIRTPYTDIIADVIRRYNGPGLVNPFLFVDRTGVGWPVFGLLRQTAPRTNMLPVTITAGDHVIGDGGYPQVSRSELAGLLQVLLSTHRLKVSPTLPLAAELTREIASFRSKVNIAPGAVTFEAWREREAEDIVLATALACWGGEQAGEDEPPDRTIATRVWCP